jgi:hypothetical protein
MVGVALCVVKCFVRAPLSHFFPSPPRRRARQVLAVDLATGAVDKVTTLSVRLFDALWATCDGSGVIGGLTYSAKAGTAEFGTVDANGAYSKKATVNVAAGFVPSGLLTATSPASYQDAFIAAFSLVGQVLQVRKQLENWIVWLGVNAVAVTAYWSADLAYTAFLYAVYFLLAALGLRVKGGCCYHGLALNIDMDLTPFQAINPCGYEGLKTIDMKSLGVSDNIDIVAKNIVSHLSQQLEVRS